MPKKIVTGSWEGEPIWRYQTAGEKLLELLTPEEKKDLEKRLEDKLKEESSTLLKKNKLC